MKLSKAYEPQEYEADIYALWEKGKVFEPKSPSWREKGKSYSIVVPPPNANGDLHLGHALTLGLEDIAIRYHRMKGDSTLFVPGADHAGFETQVVYEKQLAKEGKSRFDFTREELYAQIWDFVALNKENYESQFRRLGASVDWDHYTYTLDEKVVRRAYATFKKMWEENLIYRGERLVNFCTFHGTGFADIEVKYEEVQGNLWHIKYPLTDGSGEIVVATTRPETMLGDTAVAVNPDDERYKDFVGKTLKLPLTQREIPIITDKMVDKDFGTGAVKITPAHDSNDFEVAGRHDLPFVTVISHEGKMTHEVPAPYRNLPVEEARKAVVNDLSDLEALDKTEDYTHSVGHCYKCGTIIQPLLREQWFVSMEKLAQPALKALHEDKIKFYPESKKDQLIAYYKNLKDWNISRQIAWGIPIPAFQSVDDPEHWIYDERVTEEIIEVDGKKYRRDPDVFDTWFSSSSWPYATLDFPDSPDFKEFYPLGVMETGADILYPWVSRMIILGLYVTGEVPFKAVYLHGLIQDEHGAKMSKSKGNVINPMAKIETYGSDAFRMGIVMDESPGNNRPYDESKIVGARNFCNKLWNAARYVEGKLGDDYKEQGNPKVETPVDAWMLRKLQQSSERISFFLEDYRFSEAANEVYHLLWDDFADWYIESSKTTPNKDMLAYAIETILKLAHPFTPFVTETIWQTLAWTGDSILATSQWPEKIPKDNKQADIFENIKEIVSEIRYIKGSLNLRGDLTMYHAGDKFLNDHKDLIKALAGLTDIKEVRDGQGLHLTSTEHRAWLDIDQGTADNFVKELGSKITSQENLVKNLEGRIANKAYVDKAPKHLVEETRKQLEEAKTVLEKVRDEHNRFSANKR